jgi:hypothetical protein
MHGQFYHDFERPLADKEKSLAWLCNSGLKNETEFNKSNTRLSTQYMFSSEHDVATE